MTQGFAPVPNWLIRDTDASIYAISVYAALASRQGKGGIYPSHKTIARDARCSERQVRRALDELEELGMVERMRRTNKSGRASNGYVLYHHGKLTEGEEFEREVTAREAATSEEVTAREAAGNGLERQSAPYIEEEPLKKNPYPYSPQPANELESAFSTFWNIYPRRAGKQAALKAFVKAAESAGSEVVLAGARRFRDDPNLPEPKFVPHPATWLNQGRWEDDPLPPRGGVVAAPSAAQGWFELAGQFEERGEIGA